VGRRRYNRAVSRIYTLRDADAIVPDIAVVVQRLRDLRDEVIALRDATRLREAAAAIGETDEEERCAFFLHQLDPAWNPPGHARA